MPGVLAWPLALSHSPADTPHGSGRGHPRGAGAHAKFLLMAREDDSIELMDALWKLSYGRADFLDDSMPQFKTRGRLQEGMTAD